MLNCCKDRAESIGTIHYRVSCKKEDRLLFFVPDSNHSLKYSGTSYAVFICVPQPADKDVRAALAVPLRNNENHGIETSVTIKLPNYHKMHDDVLQVVLQAAQNHTKVTVTVRPESTVKPESFELVGITFPAR